MILALMALLSFSPARATSDQGIYPTIFDDVLAFGASVTHATPALAPPYEWMVKASNAWGRRFNNFSAPADLPAKMRPYGLSPVRYLVKAHVGRAGLKNITYISSLRNTGRTTLGSTQILRMLYGKHRSNFDRATLLVGLDAFYWDAISDNCGPDLDTIITAFLSTARDAGKTVLLGTVPVEDPAKVRIDTDRIGLSNIANSGLGLNLWWPPVPACAEQINSLLVRLCTTKEGCHLVDLHAMVASLNAGEKLSLNNGESYGLFEMRPDGVHLSDVGSRYCAEQMTKSLGLASPSDSF